MSFCTEANPITLWHPCASEAEAADSIEHSVRAAIARSYVIGCLRCRYLDHFLPDRAMLEQGLLRAAGSPYPELARRLAGLNRALVQPFSTSAPTP